MIDFNIQNVQVGPNPAYAGEPFVLSIKITGKSLRWNDIKDRTWYEVGKKGWD